MKLSLIAIIAAAALGMPAASPLAAQSAQLFTGYDPSPAYPFGRPNPSAPAQLAEFSFMIGEFDCTDTLARQDGSRSEFPAVWNARYFLNGMGIIDEYWSPTFATSNVRIYDPQAGKWMVTFFRMPGYGSGVWTGGEEGDSMIMRQAGSQGYLEFYDITEDGFKWHTSNDSWTSQCTRRR